jgi:hypothetical protein
VMIMQRLHLLLWHQLLAAVSVAQSPSPVNMARPTPHGETYAPGLKDLILERAVFSPTDLERDTLTSSAATAPRAATTCARTSSPGPSPAGRATACRSPGSTWWARPRGRARPQRDVGLPRRSPARGG